MFTTLFEKTANVASGLMAGTAALAKNKNLSKGAFNAIAHQAESKAVGRAVNKAVPAAAPVAQKSLSTGKLSMNPAQAGRLSELKSNVKIPEKTGLFGKKKPMQAPSKTSLPAAKPQSSGNTAIDDKIARNKAKGSSPTPASAAAGAKSAPSAKAEGKGNFYSNMKPENKTKLQYAAGGLAAGALAHHLMSGNSDGQQRPQLGY